MLNGITAAWASLDNGLAWGMLVDGGLKGGVLLGVTWLGLRLAPPRASATRHLAWCLAMASLLLLPLLSWVLPAWRLPVLPASAAISAPDPAQLAPASNPVRGPKSRFLAEPLAWDTTLTLASSASPAALPSAEFKLPKPESRSVARQSVGAAIKPGSGWRKWAVAAWAAIAVLMLTSSAFGHFLAFRLSRRARPVNECEWQSLARTLAGELGIHRRVELRQCDALSTPITWGWWRPAILLPRGAVGWSEAWRRAVLVHELAHVQRWDCLTQTLAQLAGALHWPNPLAWLAIRRMGLEREQACDDLVLNAGSTPAEYAGQLLEITRCRRPQPYLADATIAMARLSTLEGRVRAILDRTRNRRGLTRALLLAGVVLMAGIAGPTAAIKLIAKSPLAAAAKTPANSVYSPSSSAPSLSADTQANRAPATQEPLVDGKEYLDDFPPYGELPRFSRMLVEQQLGRAVAQKLTEQRYRFTKFQASLSAVNLQVIVTVEGLCARQETNSRAREVPLSGQLTAKYSPETGRYRCQGEEGLRGLAFEVPVSMDIDMQFRADTLFQGNAKWDLGLKELRMNLKERKPLRGYSVSECIVYYPESIPAGVPPPRGMTNAVGN